MSRGVFVGIDAGSSATKCVVLGGNGRLMAHAVTPSGFDYGEAAEAALRQALAAVASGAISRTDAARETTGLPEFVSSEDGPPNCGRLTSNAVAYCVSTGYGRARVDFADRQVTEISCHARGAREWYPQVRGIVDIGGQDTKVIWVNSHGELLDYRMNAKCAAGTGTFLESIALKLGVSLAQIDELALGSSAATVVNSFCTVFAGTEVIERIKAGEPRQDISMGLFRSIASRVFEMLASRDGPVAATGGVVAHCRAMVRALEEALGTTVLLPPFPQQAGAYGAALLAREFEADPDSPRRTRRARRVNT